MNRESEIHFASLPNIETKRAKFERPMTYKTTFNAGQLIPIYVDADIMPGDTIQIDMGAIIRESTPIAPVMDNAYVDCFAFFVPSRLVWAHQAEFWGENNLTAWEQEIEYEVPQVNAPEAGWEKGSLADYMGIPTLVPGKTQANPNGLQINALPGRAYCKIYNDWFRSTPLQDGVLFNTDETTLTGKNGTDEDYDPKTDTQLYGAPLKACKFHDRFTSCLPEPQLGPAVELPIAGNTIADVYAGEIRPEGWNDDRNILYMDFKTGEAANWKSSWGENNKFYELATRDKTGETISDNTPLTITGDAPWISPNNLYADLNILNSSITINQLRTSIAIQQYQEALARAGGGRYIDIIKALFNVDSSDARLQRSEYLGGFRQSINMDQVLQTSATDQVTPQGNTGAFSCTALNENMFIHSFEEWGTLMILAVIRTDNTYQQGLHPMWSRKKRLDYYNPYLANLGEQAVKVKEIFCTGTPADEEVFGYQEAWSEYRYGQSIVTGAMRSNYEQTLDVWHYADYYTEQPILDENWIEEQKTNVDRTIAVQSEIENQYIADFYFDAKYTRPMPAYSVPGLARL